MTAVNLVFECEAGEPNRGARWAMNTVSRTEFLREMARQWDWFHEQSASLTCAECFHANGHAKSCSAHGVPADTKIDQDIMKTIRDSTKTAMEERCPGCSMVGGHHSIFCNHGGYGIEGS